MKQHMACGLEHLCHPQPCQHPKRTHLDLHSQSLVLLVFESSRNGVRCNILHLGYSVAQFFKLVRWHLWEYCIYPHAIPSLAGLGDMATAFTHPTVKDISFVPGICLLRKDATRPFRYFLVLTDFFLFVCCIFSLLACFQPNGLWCGTAAHGMDALKEFSKLFILLSALLKPGSSGCSLASPLPLCLVSVNYF